MIRNIINIISSIILKLKIINCKLFNTHFHPEKDGIYITGLSYSKCYSCGKIIKKTKTKWILADDINEESIK